MTDSLLVTEEDPGAVGFVNLSQGSYARGIGIIGDIESLVAETKNDGWLGEFGAVISLGANSVSAAFNPIASASGWVVSWIIDHLHPLQDMLQDFTGDPDEVNAGASTWANIAQSAHAEADEIDSLLGKIDGESSKTLDAYRGKVKDLGEILRAQGDAANEIAGMLQKQAGIVDFLYNFIRDLISEAIGIFIQSATEALLSVGTAIPLVVAQISAWVSEKVAYVTKWVNKALDAFAEAGKLQAKLANALRSIGRFARGASEVLNKPGDLVNSLAGKAGTKFGNSFSRSGDVDAASSIVGQMRGRNPERVAALSEGLPDSFTKTPKVREPVEGKEQIPAELTQDLIRARGPKEMSRMLDEAGLDPKNADLSGWVRSLSAEQRAVFAREFTKSEARPFLKNMNADEQMDLFSALPEENQRDRLMGINKVVKDEADFRDGASFFKDDLGPVAAGESKWIGLVDKMLADEEYDQPK